MLVKQWNDSRRALRRGGAALPGVRWSMADQVLSSASNLALIVVAARTSSPETFGAFSLAYLGYAVALGVGRAGGADVLLLRAGADPEQGRTGAAPLLAVALALGFLLLPFLLVAGVIGGDSLGRLLIALALVLPMLLMQDAVRHCFFARREPRAAVKNDLIWIVLQAAGFALVLANGLENAPEVLLLAWGIAAGGAGAIGARRLGVRPRFSAVGAWVRHDRERIWGFVSDFLLTIGSVSAAIYLVGAIAGLAAVAAIRGAELLFQPLNALFSGLRVLTLPALAKAATDGGLQVRVGARNLSAAYALTAAAWAAVVLALPDVAGRAILGVTWSSAEALLLAIGVLYLARAAAVPAMDGLRALGAARRLILVRLVFVAMLFTGTVAGAAAGGGHGAAYGLALASCAGLAAWWGGLLAASRRRADTRSPLAPQPFTSSSGSVVPHTSVETEIPD